MALPKIAHPIFTLKLPSTGETVKFRPYTVKEEKLLLVAFQENTTEAIIDAIKQLVQNCVLSKLKVDEISTFDVEYLFVKIRAKSVSNVVELTVKDGDADIKLSLNLDEVEVFFPEGHNKKIAINDDVGLVMKYPALSFKATKEDPVEALFEMIASSIDIIYEGEKVMKQGTDFTVGEAYEFLDSLDKQSFEKIETFFDTMPVLQHVLKYKNAAGEDKEVTLRGLADFFR